jgi:hypothetical protein
MAGQYRLNALQIVQEACLRLGITRPLSIEGISGTVAQIVDKDAELLLGALNQSLRMAMSAFSWKELIRIYDKPVSAGTSWSNINVNSICVGFDGIVSDAIFFYSEANDASFFICRLLTLDRFLKTSHEDKDPSYIPNYGAWYETVEDKTRVGYILSSEVIHIITNKQLSLYVATGRIHMNFAYKTRCAVVTSVLDTSGASIPGTLDQDELLRPVFKNNIDWSPIDDEVLILGLIVSYKNYVGRDFTLEYKLWNDYIEHMKERTGGLTVIEENMYNSLAQRLHRYPPSSPAPQTQAQPAQQQQPQQQKPNK